MVDNNIEVGRQLSSAVRVEGLLREVSSTIADIYYDVQVFKNCSKLRRAYMPIAHGIREAMNSLVDMLLSESRSTGEGMMPDAENFGRMMHESETSVESVSDGKQDTYDSTAGASPHSPPNGAGRVDSSGTITSPNVESVEKADNRDSDACKQRQGKTLRLRTADMFRSVWKGASEAEISLHVKAWMKLHSKVMAVVHAKRDAKYVEPLDHEEICMLIEKFDELVTSLLLRYRKFFPDLERIDDILEKANS